MDVNVTDQDGWNALFAAAAAAAAAAEKGNIEVVQALLSVDVKKTIYIDFVR